MKKWFIIHQYFKLFFLIPIFCISAQDDPFGPPPNLTGNKPSIFKESSSNYTRIGYGVDMLQGFTFGFESFPIPDGVPITLINNSLSDWVAGADIDENHQYFGCYYGAWAGNGKLVSIDLSTGVPTLIGSINHLLYATSMAYDNTTGIWYFGDTDGINSNLYIIDITTGNANLLGTIVGISSLITLVIDYNGNAYGIDISTDKLYSINLSTLIATEIGPLGFDASYGQDADFDDSDGTLYLAAFNNTSNSGELRSVDVSTGNSTLIVTWPADVSFGGFAIDNPGSVSNVSVTSPNGGEVWIMNESSEIVWSSENVDSVTIKLSIDNGSNWTTIVDSLPSSGSYSWVVNSSASSDECLVRITDISNNAVYDESDSVFTIENASGIDENEVVSEYILMQNYPNPFNNSTVISYSLSKTSFVTIKIFDALGNEIATLVNDVKSSGLFKLNWNADNLPSGFYFYQLIADNLITTKKMILLK